MLNRFPFIQQRDSMQCGPACLAMVSEFYGKNYSLSTLSELASSTREGVSLAALEDAATALGFECCSGKLRPEDFEKEDLPCILYWDYNHFVVLYKIRKDKFHICDPAKGRIAYSKEEFKSHWECTQSEGAGKGIALFLKPTENFGNYEEKTEELNSFRFLANYFTRYSKYFAVIICGLIVTSCLQLIMPFLTQWIVDIGIRHQDIGLIWLILCGELFIISGRTVTDFIRRWILLHISMRINISLISDFFIKLLRLPMSYFDSKLLGDLLQRIGDHSRIQSFLSSACLGILFSIINFIVFGIVLFIYNTPVFLVFITGSIIYGIWTLSFLNRRKILDYESFEKQAANQNKVYQFVSNLQEIKLHGCENRRREEWEDCQAELFLTQMKSLKMQQKQEAGAIFINELTNILITVLTATAVISGDLTLGAMLAIQYITGQLSSPVDQIMGFIYSLQDVKISLERINEIHCGRGEEDNQDLKSRYTNPEHGIILHNVHFKYDPHSSINILENINIDIPKGKVTAIVGASGSGKTTLIKMMLGYYPALSGTILLSDTPIWKYSPSWWRSRCGAVMQDGVIFSESIARNIAIDDNDIDIERLVNAAKTANIYDYVMSLPLKFNTIIGDEGNGISQGQKQRILIARAVYKSPDFIFLDEATNSLDAENEAAIVNNLTEFYKGKTVIIVAHRLSTVVKADQILVLEKGRIIEQGTHTELISSQGAYYNLIKNQLELGV